MAYQKQTWENLPNQTTPITAERLNHMEDGIYEASIGTSIEVYNDYNTSTTDSYSCNYVNGLNTYSTDEIRVGTWIDGKPIYRITITGETNQGTNVEAAVSYPGVDAIVNIGGFYYSSGSPSLKIAALGNTGAAAYDNGNLKYYFNNSGSTKYFYNIVFEYTKTTD